MNQTQIDRVIKIIEKDANSTLQLFQSNNKACFMGGLLEDMDSSMRLKYSSHGRPSTEDNIRLQIHYGMTGRELKLAVQENDLHTLTRERRVALKRLIRSFLIEE